MEKKQELKEMTKYQIILEDIFLRNMIINVVNADGMK